MIKPIRLQLSRRAGFNLQRLSIETNGLPAINVARPSKWGNPFNWNDRMEIGGEARAKGAAVDLFREWLGAPHRFPNKLRPPTWSAIHGLAGNNLACWCALGGAPCHADVLLALANNDLPLDAALDRA